MAAALLETGRLVGIEGRLNAAKYKEVLEENLLHNACDLRLRQRFTFHHDLSAEEPGLCLIDRYKGHFVYNLSTCLTAVSFPV